MEVESTVWEGICIFLPNLVFDGTTSENDWKGFVRDSLPDIDVDFLIRKMEDIEKLIEQYNVIKVDANKIVYDLGDIFGKSANLVVLGVLSTIKPFNLIPEEIWLSALMNVSPTDVSKSFNAAAFKKGR